MKITSQSVLFIIGPTAVGKSDLALQLAQELNGEIISADSMQVYRGMDIGTGKPSKREQKKVRHHLIDLYSPSRTFSVFDFYRRAVEKISEIQARKKTPIVVGGTGLYVRALLEGLESSPPPDLKLRKKIESDYQKKGLEFLVKKLSKIAPEKLREMDIKNPRRVIRSLEIALLKKRKTKIMGTALQPISKLGFDPIVIGLACERGELYRRIETRVDSMFLKGWIREVKKIAACRFSRTAKQAIGYSRILPLLRKKILKKEEIPALIEQIKIDTRRYAKRQLTWFRKEKVSFWVDLTPPVPGLSLSRAVLARLQ